MFSSSLFIRWRKEKESEEGDVEVVIMLSLLGSLIDALH